MKTKQQRILLLCCSLYIVYCSALVETDLPWTYKCESNLCHRTEYVSGGDVPKQSLAVCRLTCSPYRTLLPYPSQLPTKLSNTTFRFCMGKVNALKNGIFSKKDRSFMDAQIDNFKTHLMRHEMCLLREQSTPILLNINLDQKSKKSERMELDTDESYRLIVIANDGKINITINAPTKFGVRHGFATLNQLIVYDPLMQCLTTLNEIDISDKPNFAYRGIMLDTSRNFFSIKSIQTLLDAMSIFKMNTLHWHLSDTHSFSYNSPSRPEMAYYGAYSDQFQYSHDDIIALSEYALNRGIRIMPEIDMPAHTGFGFQWGEQAGLGKLVLCEGLSPWERYCLQAPCGQLNVINPNVFSVLETVFTDVYDSTGSKMFHLGGDEVLFQCWNETAEIIEYLQNNGYNLTSEAYHELWGNFTVQSYETLKSAFRKSAIGSNPNEPDPTAIFWTSTLTTAPYIHYFKPETSIIMYWENLASGRFTEDILTRGMRMILSNHDRSYMDCGFAHYVNDRNIWCSPYKDWITVYENNYKEDLHSQNLSQYENQIIGGQILLWAEVADEYSFLFKYIPRLMASAERWWSYPTEKVNSEIRSRLGYAQMHFADTMGIKYHPDLITTEWCVQNPQSCY